MLLAKLPSAAAPAAQVPARTLEMVRAGLHWSFRMSRQMLPWLLTFGWYTLVWKVTFGGCAGQAARKEGVTTARIPVAQVSAQALVSRAGHAQASTHRPSQAWHVWR